MSDEYVIKPSKTPESDTSEWPILLRVCLFQIFYINRKHMCNINRLFYIQVSAAIINDNNLITDIYLRSEFW